MQSINAARAESRRGLLLIMLAAVLWGTVGISTKTIYHLASTNPLSIGFFRLVFSLPVLFSICWARQGKEMLHVSRGDLGLMTLIGLMTALYQVCYFGAVARTGVAVATVVTLCTAPVMVAVITVAFTRKRPSRSTLVALVGALSGTAVLVLFQDRGLAPQGACPLRLTGADTGGIALAMVSAFSYGLVTLISQKLAAHRDPFQSLAISFSVGAAVLFGFAKDMVMTYTPLAWVLLVYLGTIPTALAYVLFFKGMRSTSATAASISTLLEPMVATMLAWFLFGERFTPVGFLGIALLGGSLLLLYLGATAPMRKAGRATVRAEVLR
ncbi:membrane protein, putative [Citrifermentans bemidjiense Bem]|uniref:Membrane protein, putative n=1 Tax=Citrifermentans bemidjiense (strain ATCC BAA-1014 / DSM 16622 / JCM 12645 / Bem) TaxID=404380 RepID=B5EII6_CITBB|nr:EamA family transporter [Citrifermentans bemidjiense]ACH39888.1 membrane protein, putative [Citrifermentans bemidjiense Bem]